MKRMVAVVTLVLFAFLGSLTAHQGRTDAKGGHWDKKKNTYHYHKKGKKIVNKSKKKTTKKKVTKRTYKRKVVKKRTSKKKTIKKKSTGEKSS